MESPNDTTFTRGKNTRSPYHRPNGGGRGKFTDDASWSGVPPDDLANFVQRVVDAGSCVIFSKSSDGGVLSITVIFGNERLRAFPRSADDAIVAMRDMMDELMC